MIRAILFDLDDTLIPDEPVTAAAMQEAAEWVVTGTSAKLEPGRLAVDALAAAREIWQQSEHFAYCHRVGHSAPEGLWARYDRGSHPAIAALRDWAPRYRVTAWQEALRAQGVESPDLATSAADRFFQARRRFPLFPETEQVLTALKARGYRLGLVTNGVPDLQREKLDRSGLAGWFDAVAVSGELDCGKPDPGIFAYACATLGVSPVECVMVGDNPERDMAGAMAAGMRSVWVQRYGRERHPRYPGDWACDSLNGLVDWLAAH